LALGILLFSTCKKYDPKRITKITTKEVVTKNQTSINALGFIIDLSDDANHKEFGFCYDTQQNPTVANTKKSLGIAKKGEFSAFLDNLLPGTLYYIRTYVFENDMVFYGEEKSIKTQDVFTIPTLSTIAATGISPTGATCGGDISNTGGDVITQSGVCYATTQNPTTTNTKTTDGSTSGAFTSVLSGLTPVTTYYVRAYATNSQGTAYGNEISFTTTTSQNTNFPSLTTTSVSNISSTTAIGGGNITAQGSSSITARGVCWSTTTAPTTANSKTTNGTGIGIYTSNITGLTANTTYFVRAYATNTQGTSYGSEISFTTFTLTTYPGTMITVTGGTFQMGSSGGYSDELPIHSVTLSSYKISKYEVTNAEFAAFLNAYGQSTVKTGTYAGQTMINASSGSYDWGLHQSGNTWTPVTGKENFPIINVTWYGATEFCKFYGLRLPTEAEWEFAARGGTSSQNYLYAGSNTIDVVAWYTSNSGATTHAVGTKTGNEIGIYDMTGNVWEWCSDWYGTYSSTAETNPIGVSSGSFHVIRGGSWSNDATKGRAADRGNSVPEGSIFEGFRVCKTL